MCSGTRGGPGEQGDRRVRRGGRARVGVERRARPLSDPGATIYSARVRLSRVIRATAWGVVAAGVAAPLLRKRISAPPLATQTVAFAAPLALCLAVRRSRTRDVAVCTLQMWAYLAAYKSPHDDERGAGPTRAHRLSDRRSIACSVSASCRRCACSARSRASTPTAVRRAGARSIACSCGPTGRGSWCRTARSSTSSCAGASAFARAAVMTYAVFDIGARRLLAGADRAAVVRRIGGRPQASGAASRRGAAGSAARRRDAEVRRMMVEYGEHFWRDGWGPLYSVFGGNPLAAMPSLHFATSLMAALLLAEAGPLAGALGCLVYRGARVRAGLPGRALCRRPARGRGADGGGAASGPARGAGVRGHRAAVAALEAVAHG